MKVNAAFICVFNQLNFLLNWNPLFLTAPIPVELQYCDTLSACCSSSVAGILITGQTFNYGQS